MGRRHQSKSIGRVAFDMEQGSLINVSHWSIVFLVTFHIITCLGVTLQTIGKMIESLLMTLFGRWSANQTVSSVDCNSNFKRTKAVVRTQRHCLHADKFPMFTGGCTWHEVCRDLNPYWFEYNRGLSP